ncbi:MAG: hypothetical protein IPF41_16930 [Flavobacteriales bacterium]|nr:hypothetical protein [Flavobacteriales bacterium]
MSTPDDDDILYIVDAEQKKPASPVAGTARGNLQCVYRVGTQAPVKITVFRAPNFTPAATTPDDRKARSWWRTLGARNGGRRARGHERELRAQPAACRLDTAIEWLGPSGKTHMGLVDAQGRWVRALIVRNSSRPPRASRERLTIRNYFDEPPGEDMMSWP